MVDPGGGGFVPDSQPVDDRRNKKTSKGRKRGGRKIGKILVPSVAHGGMDIADVESIGVGDDPFGDAMGARDHEIEFPEVKKLRCEREKGKIKAIFRAQERQPLKEAHPDSPLFDRLRLASSEMEKRIDRRRRKNLGQHLEDLLPSPLTGEPVMDQSDSDLIHRG